MFKKNIIEIYKCSDFKGVQFLACSLLTFNIEVLKRAGQKERNLYFESENGIKVEH